MSYYDDDYDDDDYDDDDCSSEDDVYYHNYSVDYANQILGGQHALSSCVPLTRRKHHRHTPRLVRVSTLDQMPIVNRQRILPSLHSRPKYNHHNQDLSLPVVSPTRLPSLEATNDELERRATRRIERIPEEISNNVVPAMDNNSSSETTQRPMSEAELRQVQQQQEAFQQHLLNMQRHLLEQTKQAEQDDDDDEDEGQQQQQQQQRPQRVPTSSLCTTSQCSRKRPKVSFHDLERDDDQAQIAQLIETDPYFAAAMEDFAHSHGLIPNHRHRTHSDHSSSRHSQHSQQLCKRHRKQSSRLSHSSSSSTMSSVTNVTPDLKGSNSDLILFNELRGIRQLMQEFVRNRNNLTNNNPPTISVLPVPWPMPGGQFPPTHGIHYPPVPPVTDYQPSMVPIERPLRVPEPTRAVYQNVVNAVKDVIDRRSPSQREQPLKPSDIDPKLKHVYTKRPRIIPSSNPQPTSIRRPSPSPSQPTSIQRPPLPPTRQKTRRRSSQISTPPIVQPPPPPSSNNIPIAPPYEALANMSSSRKPTRTLSYGNRQNQSHIYDTLVPGNYLGLYTNKYN